MIERELHESRQLAPAERRSRIVPIGGGQRVERGPQLRPIVEQRHFPQPALPRVPGGDFAAADRAQPREQRRLASVGPKGERADQHALHDFLGAVFVASHARQREPEQAGKVPVEELFEGFLVAGEDTPGKRHVARGHVRQA